MSSAPTPLPPRVVVPHAIDVRAVPRLGAVLHRDEGTTMGTTWSVRVVGPRTLDRAVLRALVEAELQLVIEQMSTWEPGSLISRYNAAAAATHHALPEAFATVLDCALEVAELSDGAFDPTCGRLVDLWGFGPRSRADDAPWQRPAQEAIRAALAAPGWRALQVWRTAGRHAPLPQPGGVQLDFSGIAKGHAVDRVSNALAARGWVHHLVEIGGELRGSGLRPDGQPWWVEIETPLETAVETAVETATTEPSPTDGREPWPRTRIALHGLAVATSGDYRRHHTDDTGRRHAHTLDPRRGAPVHDAPASVTVLHADAMRADAWATALTVLDAEDSEALAARCGVAALIVRRTARGWRETLTPAFAVLAA